MKYIFSSVTLFLLFQISVSAQQTDSIKTTLSEIVVTATKTETPYYALGSSVSIISSEEIAKQHLQTVIEVLREIPGLTIIQQGGPGKLANVFIRGSNPNHTLVIIDGVVVNDASSPNNAFDFSTLNTNDIDRIEVVRGPQSTLYGSNAIAGIISIITKQGTERPKYSFLAEAGSNNFYRGNVSALGSYGVFHYAIAATRNGSRGVSASDSKFGNQEKDGYANNAFTTRLGMDFAANLNLDLIYRYTKSKTDLDQSEKFGDDPNFTYDLEEQLFKGELKTNFWETRLQQKFSASFVTRFSRALDLVDQFHPNTSSDSFDKAERIKFDWQNNLNFIKNNLLMFGIETETEKANTSYYSTSDFGPFVSVFPEQSIRTTGIYLQDQYNYASTFFTTIGVRYDNNDKFGNVTTFRITPAYFINETGTKIKMSYGTGFKAPSLFYLFDPAFGNPDLKPEKSKGWDAGVEQYFENEKYSLGITYFNLGLENMFGFDSNFKTVNIAKASSHGIEFTTSAANIHNFSLNANYTFTETKDGYELSEDFGKSLLRRPKHQASFIMNYVLNNRTNFNLQLQYVGKREDKDFSVFPAQRVIMPDYTLVNFSVSYKFSDYLELTARIDNLFDKQYEEVLYYGTLGRCFYAGLNFNL